MQAVNEAVTDGDFQQLYETFQRLSADQRTNGQDLVREVFLQPASLAKLRIAACQVLKGWAARHDLLADVMQEATILVTNRMGDGKIPFSDQGPDCFRGWLWTVWRNATSDVWKRYRATLARQRRSIEHYVVHPELLCVQKEFW